MSEEINFCSKQKSIQKTIGRIVAFVLLGIIILGILSVSTMFFYAILFENKVIVEYHDVGIYKNELYLESDFEDWHVYGERSGDIPAAYRLANEFFSEYNSEGYHYTDLDFYIRNNYRWVSSSFCSALVLDLKFDNEPDYLNALSSAYSCEVSTSALPEDYTVGSYKGAMIEQEEVIFFTTEYVFSNIFYNHDEQIMRLVYLQSSDLEANTVKALMNNTNCTW